MATIPVHAGDNLQTAINGAVAGDVLVLDDGATFTGAFTLPVHSGSTAITIEGVTVPTAGVRVSPAGAVNFPKLLSSGGGDPALATVAGAHDWTIIGIEFLPVPGGFNDILRLGDGSSAQNDLSQVPYNLTLDRCYIHGDATVGQKRGVALNSGNTTIQQCYISDCKAVGQDSQAIGGWNGPGPYLINDNYLEAAGENFLLGGAATWIPLNIPSDLTFTNNTVAKPLAWRSQGWAVKNLFELKAAQRWVVDSNTFDNSWKGDQEGHAIVITVRNSDYNPPSANNYWSNITDGLFSRNTIRHASMGVQILGHEDTVLSGGTVTILASDGTVLASSGTILASGFGSTTTIPSGTLTNLTIRDNVFSDISESYNGSGRWLELQYGDQITIVHNTVITTQTYSDAVAIALINHPITNFVYQNNIATNPQGSGAIFVRTFTEDALNGLVGTAALNALASPYTFSSNVTIGGTATGYPSGNFYPATIGAVGFTNVAGNDYRLLTSSPYHNAGSDGMDIGARFANAPAPGGTPPPPPPPPPPSCSYAVSPTTIAVAAAGGSGTIAMTTGGSCAWTATSNVAWTTIPSGASGTGNGTISYTIAPNATTSTRSGTITAGTQSIPVTQAAAVAPPPDPPGTPANPVPADTATNVSTAATLAWNLTSNTTSYTVAFGTTNTPPTVATGQTGTTYRPTLATSTTYYWQITAVGPGGSTAGPVWSFSTAAPPAPPSPPTTPNPPTGAVNVSTGQVLSWNPTANTLSYAVQFGTASTPPLVVSSQAGTSYTPALAHSTTYYWQITSTGTGGSVSGPVWSFTTDSPPPPPPPPPPPVPGTPTHPTPADATVDVPIQVTLTWSADNATTYDVAFGTSNPPSTVSSGQAAASYTPSPLAYLTTYYWSITAINVTGSTAGPVWSFTTVTEPAPPPSVLPGTPSDPTPTDGATDVCPHASLSWSANNATSYDVALSTTNPPTLVSAGQASHGYTPTTPLAWETTYYWQVTAINDHGRTDGPIWSFTTAAAGVGIIIEGATVGTLLPWVKPQFFTADGEPVAGGLLYFYVTRTTTLLATFSDVGLTIPNTNPVVLNSAGQMATSVFLQPTGYTVRLVDRPGPDGVQLWSVDDVEAINADPPT